MFIPRYTVWERGIPRLVCLNFLFYKNCQTNCRQSGSSSRHTPLRAGLRSRPAHRSPFETHRAAWHCSLQPSPGSGWGPTRRPFKLHTVPPHPPSAGNTDRGARHGSWPPWRKTLTERPGRGKRGRKMPTKAWNALSDMRTARSQWGP